MVEVVYTAERVVPELYFVGKKFSIVDGTGDSYVKYRDEVIESKVLEKLVEDEAIYDDALTCLMINEEEFSYWVGYFFNSDVKLPNDFDWIKLPKSKVIATWVKGNQSELYGQSAVAQSMLALKKADIIRDISFDQIHYYFERYDNRRFRFDSEETILDYGFYIKGGE